MRVAIAAVLVVGLVGCDRIPGTNENAARQAKALVREQLIDPESARFEDVVVTRASGGGRAVCGWVNAKNRMGGYVGQEVFLVEDGNVLFVEPLGAGNVTAFGSCAVKNKSAMARAMRDARQ